MTNYPVADGLLPDIPGRVHGLVSIAPPTVQCDGCGYTFTGSTLAKAVLLSGVLFNPRTDDPRRLCSGCRDEAGWVE